MKHENVTFNHFFPLLLPGGGLCSCKDVPEPFNVALLPSPTEPLEPMLFPRAEPETLAPDKPNGLDDSKPVDPREEPKRVVPLLCPKPEFPVKVPVFADERLVPSPLVKLLIPVEGFIPPNPETPFIEKKDKNSD